ncbi:MAG: ZIP family metal transporter [Nitrososphaerales archaeon]
MLHLLYALLAAAADIGSGAFALHPKFTGVSQRYTVALASGVVVSAAFLELLPESDVESNAIFVVLGFFTFYLIEKAMLLHACGEKECESHTMGWTAVAGMASDNLVDGVGIAIAYFTDPAFGLVITVAVVLHEIPQGMASTVLMQKAGYDVRKIFLVLTLAGASYPLGALISAFIPPELYVAIIAFVAGDFIYIGAGDLLGEAHRRFNYKVVLTTILGAALFVAIETLI